MRWTYTPPLANEVETLQASARVNRIIAELLLRNGLADPEVASRFLNPKLATLHDPFLLQNLRAGAARLQVAIVEHQSVTVLGDYDVDGVSSTTLLVGILRRFGLQPHFVVPRRSEDGYGLSLSAIDRALEAGVPDVFVALDCGTNSHAEVAYLIEKGCDVIVVDHHRSTEQALAQGLLINPHVSADEGQVGVDGRNLCTVGLVFKLVHGLLKLMREKKHPTAFEIKLSEELDLVAMGTVADLVPLQGENRTMARYGLRVLRDTRRPGLRALMTTSGLSHGQDLTPVDISFRLGPRINASGRLADAAMAVELLLSDDHNFGAKAASELDRFNRERQEIERGITKDAERMVDELYADDPGIVLYSEDWHPGVVGIVAGRVTRKYNRPCVVLGNDGDLAKGSGRSVNGVNLVEILAACTDELDSWGGHPMAVGVGAAKDKLESFRSKFAEAIRAQSGSDVAELELAISAWMDAGEVDEKLMKEIESLHPFGQGNSEPIFGVRGVRFKNRSLSVFKDLHFRFFFDVDSERRLHGVAWKMADRLPPLNTDLDLAVKLAWNHFNGRKLLQMELIDWRLACQG